MTKKRAIGLAAGMFATAAIPCLALAQSTMQTTRPPAAIAVAEGSVFKCEGGRDLTARFSSSDSKVVAIVDVGEGPHILPLRPWDGGEPQVTWSDGQRTLTWNVGVQLMWMDGPKHLACGRGEHLHEG